MKAHTPEQSKWTLNQASRALDRALLAAVNGSGLPLRMVELQVLNLLRAVQDKLEQEEAAEVSPPAGKDEPNG